MDTTNNDKGKYLLKLILVITAVYICVEYLLFIFLPFLIAYILKLILKPVVDYCEKRFSFNRKCLFTRIFRRIFNNRISKSR